MPNPLENGQSIIIKVQERNAHGVNFRDETLYPIGSGYDPEGKPVAYFNASNFNHELIRQVPGSHNHHEGIMGEQEIVLRLDTSATLPICSPIPKHSF
jgi:hypothetical protein